MELAGGQEHARLRAFREDNPLGMPLQFPNDAADESHGGLVAQWRGNCNLNLRLTARGHSCPQPLPSANIARICWPLPRNTLLRTLRARFFNKKTLAQIGRAHV